MKRLLVSLLVISSIASAGFALSNAFFSDTETSVGNTFAAGKVDLLIGNDSYYNGNVSGVTSFPLGNLSENTLFFNFDDIKPSDWGEDTITLQVDDNNAWVCADLSLTANLENTCNEPELLDEPLCQSNDIGELGDAVNFAFWVDDGDNVYELNESLFASGSATQLLTQSTWALADSQSNIFPDRPLIGGQEYYIGKYWCFGQLTPVPQPQNNTNSPTTNSGFTCNGSTLDNSTQTDSLEASLTFRAVQSRNNPDFTCSDTDTLWMIGQEQINQTDNPVAEFNFTGLGQYPDPGNYTPSYTRNIILPFDPTADQQFPWNSDFSNGYARTILINFNYAGATTDALLTLRWSPGASGTERKQIYLNDNLIQSIGPITGTSSPDWWSNYPMRIDTATLTNLTPGNHQLRLEQTTGNGTVWDYIKLEKLYP